MSAHQFAKWSLGCAITLGLAVWIQPAAGQAPQVPPLPIQSLAEPDQGFAVNDVSPQTGFVTFAASPRNGMLLPVDLREPAQARALRFVELYGRPFGLTDSSQLQLIEAAPADALGLEHVRFQQVHQGVPIRGAEFIVHLRGARAMAANGHVLNDLPDSVIPQIAGNVARTEAVRLIEKHKPDQAAGAVYSEPRLEILNRGLLSDYVNHGSRLAWFVEATGTALREYIWVDARSGVVLLNFSQLADAKSRKVYDANHTDTLPGTLRRSEGEGATGDADVDNAYDYSGFTYDYFFTNHGRDSYDNAGAQLISTTHYCKPPYCPSYQNAFWNGTQMVYGDGFSSADDVVAHELTHAVTEHTANLLYYVQSGALNESFSDIFGEAVDLTDGVGNDAADVRWKMGEDLPIGAIRNMMDPNWFGDPAKMSDVLWFVCTDFPWTDGNGDMGGVHSNSGIPNHAFALMVDGGTYNGKTVAAIGLTKAAKIQYRALSTYLTSGATFLDNYMALNQSCTDLIGTSGITAGDCTQVTNAIQAVEMNSVWACAGATPPPPMCTTGVPNVTQNDTFETDFGNWTPSSTAVTWVRDHDFAKSGKWEAWGEDPPSESSHTLTMTSAVTVPAGGRLYFDHAFEFENDLLYNYDGGLLEYSTDDGATWVDASSLIDAGQNYNGTADVFGRPSFVKTSFGYTGTRLNLSSLAGQSVKFRFLVASDVMVGSLGWAVDNVSFYTCSSSATITCGTPVTGDLAANEEELWGFDGAAGDTVWVSVVETAEVDLGFSPQVEVRRPDGTVLANVYASDAAAVSLDQTGRYTLRVYDSGGDRGSYRLRLEWLVPTAKQCTTQTISCGTPVTGDLDTNDQNLRVFDGAAGDTVWVSVVETAEVDLGFSPQVEVRRPDGTVLANVYASDAAAVSLDQTGRYTLRVYDSGGDRGSYRLRLEWLAPTAKQCTTQAISCGTPVTGDLDTNDQNLRVFDGAAGDTVWVSVVETAEVDLGFSPQVEVRRPDGTVQTYVYPGAAVPVALSQNGRYTLRVYDVGGERGSYRLQVDCPNAGLPNLQVTTLKAPATAGAGSVIKVTDTTKNAGTALAAASLTKLWLSVDKVVGNDTLLGSRAVGSLAASATETGTTTVTLPAVAPRRYYVIAQADGNLQVAESNETDNTRVKAIYVGPDLVIKSMTFDPPTPTSSSPTTITVTTKNSGGDPAGPSVTRVYRSANAKVDAGDDLLGQFATPGLLPNASSTGSVTVTLPAGTYYLIAVCDATNSVIESRETNNTKKVQKTVP